MYYPQTYHHIQEIQKYNIQDYRPRYVFPFSLFSFLFFFSLHTQSYQQAYANLYVCVGWNNSKKQSAK